MITRFIVILIDDNKKPVPHFTNDELLARKWKQKADTIVIDTMPDLPVTLEPYGAGGMEPLYSYPEPSDPTDV